MNFKEDSFMVAIALCVVFFVVAQALFFLVRAVKRAKELGIANQQLRIQSFRHHFLLLRLP